MIPAFIIRFFMILVGYVLPAYGCFKLLESRRQDARLMRRCFQYWIIMAMFTAVERLADLFLSWMFFYREAKLGFICFLLFPNMEGAEYIYTRYVQPQLGRHESDIDRHLSEIKQKAEALGKQLWAQHEPWIRGGVQWVMQLAADKGLVDVSAVQNNNRASHRD